MHPVLFYTYFILCFCSEADAVFALFASEIDNKLKKIYFGKSVKRKWMCVNHRTQRRSSHRRSSNRPPFPVCQRESLLQSTASGAAPTGDPKQPWRLACLVSCCFLYLPFLHTVYLHGVRAVCPSQIYLANITHIRFVVVMNLAVVPATTDTAVQTHFCSSLRINKDTVLLPL